VEQELLTITEYLSSPFFSGVHVTRSIVFCVMFCRSSFVLLSFFFFSLCRLFFDLRIMIIPLVSSIFLDSIAMQFTFICSGTYAIHLAFLCSRINGGMNGCYILKTKNRRHKEKKKNDKRTNNDLQNITQKTIDRVT
jgi:hypothetical protein